MENQDQILQYTEFLNAINPPDVYGELIEYAKENHVPIMEPVGINFLCQIVQIQQPRCAIEIGTAIGYSAIRLAHVCPQMYIYTFERDADRVFQAKSNIQKFQLENRIRVMEGDALEISHCLPLGLHADLLFIDAAKGKSRQFFETYEPYLSENPLIVFDNILFKGYIVSNEGLSRQKRSLVRKIKDFHQWMVQHPNYHTTVIPIGDGLAVCTRK